MSNPAWLKVPNSTFRTFQVTKYFIHGKLFEITLDKGFKIQTSQGEGAAKYRTLRKNFKHDLH